MPPECDGRCWEEDVKHPLASCDLEVVEGAITPEEADDVVAAAEAHAAVHGWHSQRHIAYPTRDLPWTALPSVARVFDKLWGAMEESVRRRCGVRPIDRLTPNDIFVVKYTPEGQAGLDRHRDASSFSFNAALSDPTSYGGGGTRVWLDSAVRTLREKYLRAELEGVVRDGTAPGASAEARGPRRAPRQRWIARPAPSTSTGTSSGRTGSYRRTARRAKSPKAPSWSTAVATSTRERRSSPGPDTSSPGSWVSTGTAVR